MSVPGPAIRRVLSNSDLETPEQRLAGAILEALGRQELAWQERLMEAGDAATLLRHLGPTVWHRSVLVDGWPVYPVTVADTRAWLVVGRNISWGYPVRAVYLPDTGDLVSRNERDANVEAKLVEAVVAAVESRSFPEPAGEIGALVPGHNNFAHTFMASWNAVQRGVKVHGFQNVARVHDIAKPSMGSYTEPELFPQLAEKIAPLDDFVDADGTYAGTLVPLGSGSATLAHYFIDSDLRDGVRRASERLRTAATDEPARQMSAAPFVLWISVRGAGRRTVLNFGDWIGATLDALAAAGTRPFVAFDGLSIQPGFSQTSRIRGHTTSEQIDREREVVEQIMSSKDLDYVYLGGLPLHDAFYLSRFASFYICHQGSLDHKIKWVNPNLPGLVHANLQRTGELAWEPTLDTVKAAYLPPRFIRDEKPEEYKDADVPSALYPYWIEPVDEAAAWIVQYIAEALALTAPIGVPE